MARLCPSRLSYLTDLSDREFARVEVGAIHNPTSSSDFLRRMHVEVDGVAQLVSELLDLARMDAGRLELPQRVSRGTRWSTTRSSGSALGRSARPAGDGPRRR
jgi:signal transduction histidine kinase